MDRPQENLDPQAMAELEALLEAALNDAASPEDLSRLNELVLGNEALRRVACGRLMDDSLLWEELHLLAASNISKSEDALCGPVGEAAIQTSPIDEPATVEAPKHRLWSFSEEAMRRIKDKGMLAAAVLVGAMGALVFQSGHNPQREQAAERESTPSESTPIPKLVGMTACIWEPGEDDSPSLGQFFHKGDVLRLREGIAELELRNPSGGRMLARVEGPASLFVRSDGELGLQFGAMTADVNGRRSSFAIDTPMGKVVVPENAFLGVVASTARNEVHVFDGEASIVAEHMQGDAPLTVLGEGVAVSLSCEMNGKVSFKRFEASRAAFASTRTMAFDPLLLDETYRASVLASKPALYWRFEEGEDQASNEGLSQGFVARVRGKMAWREFGRNRTAVFGVTPRAGAFEVDEPWPSKPLNSYTVEMWVKPSHFQNAALFSLVGQKRGDGLHPHALLVELGGPYDARSPDRPINKFRFLHRAPPSADHLKGESLYSEGMYAVRTWQHVVARKQQEQLQLFVDGQVVASATDQNGLPSGMQVVMAQLFPLDVEQEYPLGGVRPFVGQLDEVAIYERALSDQEIRRHHSIARRRLSDSDSI